MHRKKISSKVLFSNMAFFFMAIPAASIFTAFEVLAIAPCPSGEVNCQGACGLFTDADKNGICDRSESPENNTATVLSSSAPKNTGKRYGLIEISVPLLILYAISMALSAKGIISKVLHRKIWNIALLVSFLISGALGLLLVARIEYGISPFPNFFMLFWHVEAGIAMALISAFHVLWHLSYFRRIFSKGKGRRE